MYDLEALQKLDVRQGAAQDQWIMRVYHGEQQHLDLSTNRATLEKLRDLLNQHFPKAQRDTPVFEVLPAEEQVNRVGYYRIEPV